MKKKLLALTALLVCLAMLLASTAALADFGDFSGDSDYGWDSGDSGSSWSDSDGGSWFGGSTSDSSSSSGRGGGSFTTILVIVIILVIVFLVIRSKKKGGSQTPVTTTVKPTEDSELKPINDYIANVDHGFSAAQMQTKLANLYVQLQNQWTAKDLTPLRPYLTDELYTQSDRQLDAYRKANQTPHVERISVMGTNIRGWFQRDGMDHLIVEMSTRIVSYITDDSSGNVVRGDKNAEKFMTYEWDVARTTGVKTEAEGEMKSVNCPNCGAPVTINKSAKCPYCETVITLNEHDWVLFSIKGLSQKTNR